MNEELEMRLHAAFDATDDSNWLDVCARAQRLARPRPRRRRGRLVAGSLVTAAAVTVLMQVTPLHDAERPVPGLDAIAAVAAAAPSTVPARGEYAYTEVRFGLVGQHDDCTQEWWIARDGSGRVRQRGPGCGPHVVATNGRPLPQGLGRRKPDVRVFGPGQATSVFVELSAPGLKTPPEDLPTDPARLSAALEGTLRALRDADVSDRATRADGMFQMVEQALANPLAPPALRSALYRVAEGLDGVTVDEDVTDPAGRRGSAMRLDHRVGDVTVEREIIFDPRTSASLASRITSIHGERRLSTSYRVYLDQATVGSLRSRP